LDQKSGNSAGYASIMFLKNVNLVAQLGSPALPVLSICCFFGLLFGCGIEFE
jgi:hypothetical protein